MGFLDRLVGGKSGKSGRIEELQAKLKADPYDFTTGMALAQALLADRKKGAAVAALGSLGDALHAKGRTLEAIAVYKKVQEIDPKSEAPGTFLIMADLKRLVEERKGSEAARGQASAREAAVPSSPAVRMPAQTRDVVEARQRRDKLLGTVSGIPLLKDVPPFLLELIIQKIKERTVEAGKTVFAQGAEGASLLFVASGELAVWALDDTGKDVQLGTLGPGDVAGEISFLSGVPRTATLIAKQPTELLELERNAIEPIVRRHRALADALRTLNRERVLEGVLARSRVFRGLSPAERERVTPRLAPMTVDAGEAVVTEGAPGTTVYVVQRGELRVTARRGGRDVELAVLRPHEVFGDLAALLGTARTATVTATTPAELLRLEKADLDELLARCPQVRAELEEIQLERFTAAARILGGS